LNRISGISLTVIALVAVACGSPSATGTPAPARSAAPTVAGPSLAPQTAAPSVQTSAGTSAGASQSPAESASAALPSGAGGSAAPTPPASVAVVATIPEDQLLFAGKLVICSDLPYPPQEYFDENGNPIGSDIEIGQAIAARLGLTAQIENSVFDTIIPALTGGKCDIILSAQNINSDRLTQVDMIPYFQAGQAFLVQKGNPANLQTAQDLCGKKVAVEAGTTMLDYLSGTSSFKNGGLPKICSDANLPAVEATPFQKDSDALAALQAGAADAYFSDLPVVIGYANAQPEQFEVSPVPQIEPALEGISVAKSTEKTVPHSPIYDAVKAALLASMADGSYQAILAKYGVDQGAITPDVVNTPQVAPSTSPAAS
jgi:polar amino acid transport system substrate-binding protein